MRFSLKIEPLIILATSVLSGLYVNIFSNAIYGGDSWITIVAHLGFWNLLVPLWLVLIIFAAYQTLIEPNKRTRSLHTLLTHLRDHNKQADSAILSSIFSLLLKSANFRTIDKKLNIHIFVHKVIHGRDCLVKDRKYSYEEEAMPMNYSLDVAYPDEDKLLICDAFNRAISIYEELPTDHVARYGERIRDRVDTNIRWVLASPVRPLADNMKPSAIICYFGRTIYFESKEELEKFENAVNVISEIFLAIFQQENYLIRLSQRIKQHDLLDISTEEFITTMASQEYHDVL
jgi:hypothetical protein